MRLTPIIANVCVTRKGNTDVKVVTSFDDALDCYLCPFLNDVFIDLELDFVVDRCDVCDLFSPPTTTPFNFTLHLPPFAYECTRRL